MLGVELVTHYYEDKQDDHEQDDDQEPVQPIRLVTASSLLILPPFFALLTPLAVTVILAVFLLDLPRVTQLFPPAVQRLL